MATWMEKAEQWKQGLAKYKTALAIDSVAGRPLRGYGEEYKRQEIEKNARWYIPLQKATNRASELLSSYTGTRPDIDTNTAPPLGTPPFYFWFIARNFNWLVGETQRTHAAYIEVNFHRQDPLQAEFYKSMFKFFVDDIQKIGEDIEEVREKGISTLKGIAAIIEKNKGRFLAGGLAFVALVIWRKV